MAQLNNKIAIVTGAASGFGAAPLPAVRSRDWRRSASRRCPAALATLRFPPIAPAILPAHPSEAATQRARIERLMSSDPGEWAGRLSIGDLAPK